MSLVSEKDVSDALEILGDETGAAARAAANYFDALTKTKLAELMAMSNESSATAREQWARMQPEFTDHLKQVAKWQREDLIWRQRYAAAEAKIEVWRSINANARTMERVR